MADELDDDFSPFSSSSALGGAPNPDRKSEARKRRERMIVVTPSSQARWWLDPGSGMLTPETLKALREFRKKSLRLDK